MTDRAGRRRRVARRVLPPLAVFLLVLGGWTVVSYGLLPPRRRFLLPPVDQVIRVGFLDPDNRAELLDALALTSRVAGTGLAVAVLLGVGLGVLMAQTRWLERAIYPYVVVVQTIPVLALVPLFGFWFGFGFASRVLVCVLLSLFPLVANTLFGIRSVPAAQHQLFDLHRASRWRRLVKLQLPAALPSIFTGLRIAAGGSVIGAVVGDFFFRQGQPGLGILIDMYRSRLAAEQMFAAVLLASALGIAVFVVFGALARWAVGRWHESAE
ncbi:ABC transporter permease [Goodfellowiella coeruleoviolacea]|uniref:NitT/TauT family transport system permease protein n=1 Tax=Goodfellowiella coeruleoviolacea TaxID=334858 RepID=A0AAE3G9K1_9PSEU|nr:ABC transporter permease subunit [Goodfellowiella coeruleoviolacea]MCP2163773.1 NitT/TauT family transport system permease protein [Goodfellowiella coeruleoviolacea]